MGETRYKILIVDDSAAVRAAVAMMLRGGLYECIEAADGLEALDVLATQRVHCVISDLHMPNMNGLEFLQRLRQTTAHRFLPVLVLTTDRVDENRAELRRAGATGILSKPIDPAALNEAIQRAIAPQI